MMETDIKPGLAVGTDLRLTCDRDEFVARLAIVSRAVSTRSAVQVLAGIRLSATGGALELAATDMELSLRATGPAAIESEGAIVVPGKLLSDLARLLPRGDVTLAAQEGSLAV